MSIFPYATTSKNQTFRWDYKLYNISNILVEIEQRVIRPVLITFEPEEVESYYLHYLYPLSVEPKPPIRIDFEYAKNMLPERLKEPIILINVGSNEGLIKIDGELNEANYVVGDGNHRMVLANELGFGLLAYKLNEAESNKFVSYIE